MGIAYVVVRHSFPFKALLLASTYPGGHGGQDGAVFHCTVAVLLHILLERIYTYLRRGHVSHGGLPDRLEHSERLAIGR